MNQLAEMQKALIAKKGTPEYPELEQKFLERYYKLRNREERRFYSHLSLKQRICIHPLLLGVYKIKNRLGGFSHEIIADKREKLEQPVIFATTHVGKFDIEVISEAIKDHYFLLSGDYEHIQGNVDAPFLGLNGVLYFNEKVKSDRQAIPGKMVDVLKQGGNLMYFPEGTWNIHPCLPMLPCYWGIIDVARKGGAAIVPVAAEQYGKHFKISFGESIHVTDFPETIEGKARAIEYLRDTLATMKWEIWETEQASRKDIQPTEWDEYVAARFREWPYFNRDYIAGLIYQPKGVTAPEMVFAHFGGS